MISDFSLMAHDSLSHSVNVSALIIVVEDTSGPYFLHHGDNPRSILVTQPLTGDNYHTRSCSMLMALAAKNKI